MSRKYKIIGIHRAYNKTKKLNIRIYIKNIIEYINKNEVIFFYNITKDNIGKEIQILNCKEDNTILLGNLYQKWWQLI